MLEIKNLHVSLEEEDKQIIKGLDLTINAGEVNAIMGPNGSGKSTLSYVLAGRPGYVVTDGSITYKGQDLLEMEIDERAAAGVFLAFQYPIEIPGVATMQFLKVALNAQRKARGVAMGEPHLWELDEADGHIHNPSKLPLLHGWSNRLDHLDGGHEMHLHPIAPILGLDLVVGRGHLAHTGVVHKDIATPCFGDQTAALLTLGHVRLNITCLHARFSGNLFGDRV